MIYFTDSVVKTANKSPKTDLLKVKVVRVLKSLSCACARSELVRAIARAIFRAA